MKHHIWCNFQNVHNQDDVSDCEMCCGLRKDHPEIAGDTDGCKLGKKYFSDYLKDGDYWYLPVRIDWCALIDPDQFLSDQDKAIQRLMALPPDVHSPYGVSHEY